MSRFVAGLLITLAIAAVVFSQTKPRHNLTAPTYYIAAAAEYRHPGEIWLRGASNLPAGAILVVNVQNYSGEGSQILSVRALPKVGKDGFFEATLAPLPKMQFKRNVVCLVSFFPKIPDQDASVIGEVGRHGEQLGFPKNPQAYIQSGDNVYLSAAVHVD